jgi:hypothetical protein
LYYIKYNLFTILFKQKKINLLNFINTTIYIYNCINSKINYFKDYFLNKFFTFNNNIKLILIKKTSTINTFIKYIYTPILLLNYIISDIALSITYLLILYKKKYYINIIVIFIYKIIFKIYDYTIFYIKKYIKKLYKSIKFIVFFSIRKTIYITLILTYFYNEDISQVFINDFYNIYIYDLIIKYNLSIYINFIFNTNNIYFLTTILGLQLVLYWSKYVHRFFGNYLWTMTIFPLFLEIHKIFYFKLFCANFFHTNTFDYILLLRYNILDIFNYKIYNIYATLTNIILVLLLLYFIKKGAFRHIYAKFKYSRWFFFKYPFLICLLEIFRLKIVEYTSTFIIYINYKLNFNIWYIYKVISLSNNTIVLYLVDFIQDFIYEIYNFKYYTIYLALIPNLYFINFLIDLTMVFISARWLIIYLNKYKKIDWKFVAFPLVMLEIIGKYIFIYMFSHYALQHLYIWSIEGIIVFYAFQALVFTYIYLETRVHKVPRKTMPWYFRQIIELWPSTYLNQWYTAEYLYYDQQRYIVLRFRLKTFKIEYKHTYKKCEIWNKIIILNYQKEKDKAIRLLSAYCRLMARKENMLREINNFEYQGWYEDWEYNHHKINIYNWKLDLWDKPYFYQFKKTIFFSNVRFFSFEYRTPIERFSSKYMHLTYLFFIVNTLDFYYTQKYIYVLDRDEISEMRLKDWKKKFFTESYTLEELTHLKKLKLILMGFSSGELIKTPDWNFPYIYEKEYKKKGWAMFEDPRIDAVELDWRPTIKDLN